MFKFFLMSEKDMILASAAISILLVEGLNADEQNTLGNFLMCIGQNIASAAAQIQILEDLKNKEKIGENNQ